MQPFKKQLRCQPYLHDKNYQSLEKSNRGPVNKSTIKTNYPSRIQKKTWD